MATNNEEQSKTDQTGKLATGLGIFTAGALGGPGLKKALSKFGRGKTAKTTTTPSTNQTLANPSGTTPTPASTPTASPAPVTPTPASPAPAAPTPTPSSTNISELATKLAKSKAKVPKVPQGVTPEEAKMAANEATNMLSKETQALTAETLPARLAALKSAAKLKSFQMKGGNVDLSKLAKFGSAALAGTEAVAASPLVAIGLPALAAGYGAYKVGKAATGLKKDTDSQVTSEQSLNKMLRLADYVDEAKGLNGGLIERVTRATREKPSAKKK